jgi:hypothetical protein
LRSAQHEDRQAPTRNEDRNLPGQNTLQTG